MNFDDAIQAHADWKMKLVKYIKNPDKSLKPEIVGLDNQCALGKWIYTEGRAFANHPEYATLVAEHAKFHKAAASFIKRADDGVSISDAELGLSSDYGKLSSTVINAIRSIRNKAAA